MSNQSNPLAKHFRQPAIFLKLPSQGKFYPEGSLSLNVTGEIPVYPMTVKDELLLKTPEALLNGSSLVEMIKSCCPSIIDPWQMPLIDLDSVLIAIRLASYGQGMDISDTCVHCNASNEHTVDLRNLLDSLPKFDITNDLATFGGLTFKLVPQTFNDLNKIGLIQFEQQKIVATVTDSELPPDEKLKLFEETFKKLAQLNIDSVAAGISYIQTEDGVKVTNREEIKEFLDNTDRATYDAIKNLVSSFVEPNAIPPITVECSECKGSYPVNLEFNQTNFFE